MTVQPFSATAPVKALAGSVTEPSITFTGNTGSGLYSPGINQVAIATGGVQRLLIGSDGSITPASPLRFPLGSAGAPSISFAGDTNTGIYSLGADQLALSTSGVGRVFVDASGNVGIATSTILGKATIGVGDGADDGLSLYYNGGGTNKTVAEFHANTATGQVTLGGTAATYFTTLFSGGSERLRITSAGLVGIGTSSPATLVEGRINGAGGTPATSGTSQPNAVFRVSGSGTSGVLDIGCNSSAPWIQSTDRTDLSQKYSLLLNPNGGRVGIGTTGPSQEVDIFADKNGLTTTWVRNPNTGASAGARLLAGSHLGDVSLAAYSAANTAFGGSAAVLSTSSTFTGGLNLFAGGAAPLVFWTNSNQRARIDSSGRLLVGTSSDSGGALLQVNGDRIRVATAKTPASASDTGTAGEICWDASYIYVCTATNTWKRAALSTW